MEDFTLFDEKGNKTALPDKERQIEALQLLFMLLPPTNRSLLKLLLDLLYQTARQQDKNKMSAYNLALMFAPHILWPKNVTPSDLQENIHKLNNGMAFLVKHSQKLFRAPVYIREHARLQFLGSKILQSKDDLDLLASPGTNVLVPSKRNCLGPASCSQTDDSQYHTEEALKELFHHVNNMPESAKKKKLIRQFNKQSTPGTPVYDSHTPPRKKHARSRSFGGLIKRKVLGNQLALEKKSKNNSPESSVSVLGPTENHGKENILITFQRALDSPVFVNSGVCSKPLEDFLAREKDSSSISRGCSAQESLV